MKYQYFLNLLFILSFTFTIIIDAKSFLQHSSKKAYHNKLQSKKGILKKKYLDITIDEIDGEWIGERESNFTQLFNPGSQDEGGTIIVCRDDIPEDCQETFTPFDGVFIINATVNAFYLSASNWQNAQTIEESAKAYSLCAEQNIYPSAFTIERFGNITSYVDTKLSVDLTTGPFCIFFAVYVEKSVVKVDIQQRVDYVGPVQGVLGGAPYECIDYDVECEYDFTDPDNTVVSYNDFFTLICNSGNCLDLAKKHKGHGHH